jgi:cysteine-rich repeat protein
VHIAGWSCGFVGLAGCINAPAISVDPAENGASVDSPVDTGTVEALPPAECGNGTLDSGESCDDGARWGGDGCSADCVPEAGTFEVEPNDEAATALAATAGTPAFGALPEEDIDCWSVEVQACGAIRASQTEACAQSLVFSLFDPSFNWLASSSRGADGCAVLDPATEPAARFVEAGTWAVCVSAVNEAEVRGYALTLTTPESATLGAPSTGNDTDGDSVPDSCDIDLDGDGIENVGDNCPSVPNGPTNAGSPYTADGYLKQWLSAGPFTTGTTTGECRPSDDLLVGEDVALSANLGEPAGDRVWTALLFDDWAYDLLIPYGSTPAPREAYVLVYLYAEADESLTLSVGADDGLFAWWNGEKVLDVASCQGVNADQFQAPIVATAGWNSLLLKVRDWGGGWGFAARLLDAEGLPFTELVPSIRAGEIYVPDQTDADADGLGDVCDPEP